MFGYIKTYQPELKLRELDAYKAVYCSLCKELGRSFGFFARLSLSYDFTFLAMLAMAVSSEAPTFEMERCECNPLKKTPVCRQNDSLVFSGQTAILMLYQKLLDNRRDGGFWEKLGASIAANWMARSYRRACRAQPELAAAFEQMSQRQVALEAAGCSNVDEASEPMAQALAAVFAMLTKEPNQRRVLERLGFLLGRYVYLADALDDVEEDIASGGYNPFLAQERQGRSLTEVREQAQGSLYLTIAELGVTYELLELKQFASIIENIIYMGLKAVADSLQLPKEQRRKPHNGRPV